VCLLIHNCSASRGYRKDQRDDQGHSNLSGIGGCYPTLAGSVCIASKTMAKMSTLQAVAPKSYARW
jgi:hypothetical protein